MNLKGRFMIDYIPPDVPASTASPLTLEDKIAELLPFVVGAPVPIEGGGYRFPVKNNKALRETHIVRELSEPRNASPLRDSHEGRSYVVDLRVRDELGEILRARVLQFLEPQVPVKKFSWGSMIPGAGKREAIKALVAAGLVYKPDSKGNAVIPLATQEAMVVAIAAKEKIGRHATIQEPDPNAVIAGEPATLILTGSVARQFMRAAHRQGAREGNLFVH